MERFESGTMEDLEFDRFMSFEEKGTQFGASNGQYLNN